MNVCRRAVAGWVLLVAIATAEPPRAIPLLDQDELEEVGEQLPQRIEAPVADAGVEIRDRVESTSGQFGVTGGEAGQRGSLALQAESLRERFHQLLGEKSPGVIMPVEIILLGRPGDSPKPRPLALELRFTAQTYLLRIFVDLSRGIDHERMERVLLTSLLFQRSLKGVKPGALDSPLKTPVWLVEGVLEAEKWRMGLGDRRLYEGVFKQGGHYSMDQLLAMDEGRYLRLDGVSQTMFRVLSGALVMALLEQPRGKPAFTAFCDEVAAFEGEYPILMRRHFPELNLSERSLVKWWALTLAKLADAPVTDSMTIEESEEALADSLTLRLQSREGVMENVLIESWDELPEMEEAKRFQVIRPAQDALNRLSYRCFPSYRPLIYDYQLHLADWARKGGGDDLRIELAELTETREIMATRALRARDYLDFVEISGATDLSGSFDDYLKLKNQLKEKPRVTRTDPLSRYLDRMDGVYDPKAGQK